MGIHVFPMSSSHLMSADRSQFIGAMAVPESLAALSFDHLAQDATWGAAIKSGPAKWERHDPHGDRLGPLGRSPPD
jgi:hypothetical protein